MTNEEAILEQLNQVNSNLIDIENLLIKLVEIQIAEHSPSELNTSIHTKSYLAKDGN